MTSAFTLRNQKKKKGQNKPKINKIKEIIKIREETKEIKNKNHGTKSVKLKAICFEKIMKIDNFLY